MISVNTRVSHSYSEIIGWGLLMITDAVLHFWLERGDERSFIIVGFYFETLFLNYFTDLIYSSFLAPYIMGYLVSFDCFERNKK